MFGATPWKEMKISCAISSRSVSVFIQRRATGDGTGLAGAVTRCGGYGGGRTEAMGQQQRRSGRLHGPTVSV